MKKRADQVAETRRRITEAAMRLHTTVGPAHTTISGVAEEAGVTRVTVYNHFSNEEELFEACSGLWASLHPPPDPSPWLEIDDIADRARHGLDELYGWYDANHADLGPIVRDFEAMPPGFQAQMSQAFAAYTDALVTGSGLRGRHRDTLAAIAGHVTSFQTWQSLVVTQGLTTSDAVETATGFVASALSR